jgi:glycosyltransferase involved in cell wall biosynthesis
VGGQVDQRTGVSVALRGCRLVTTSMTARLLLGNQLRAIDDVRWSVVTGDAFDDAPEGVDVEVVPIRREFAGSDARAFVRLWRTLRSRRFDFVQTHTPKASFLGLPAARLSGATAIYTVHGSLYFKDNTRRRNLLGWMFERWCCTWAHLVLLQSREDEEVLPRARVCRADKLRFIGNGVVLDRFLEAVPPALTSSQPVVLMVSRLVGEKGCTDFFALARALSGAARFVHVGPAEHDQRDAISQAELDAASADVSFLGPVDDVRPYLASADVVVLPSYREGIPRVAMEAAVSGRPVVAYDIRGAREVVDPSTGLLAPRGDVAALVRAVDNLLQDPQRRQRLGQVCRQRVVAQFSEDDVVARLRAVYGELAARA